jgi:hypothetical protein
MKQKNIEKQNMPKMDTMKGSNVSMNMNTNRGSSKVLTRDVQGRFMPYKSCDSNKRIENEKKYGNLSYAQIPPSNKALNMLKQEFNSQVSGYPNGNHHESNLSDASKSQPKMLYYPTGCPGGRMI